MVRGKATYSYAPIIPYQRQPETRVQSWQPKTLTPRPYGLLASRALAK